MSSLLPFLYQTRTIQRTACLVRHFSSTAASPRNQRSKSDESIPFEWEDGQAPAEVAGSGQESTITPSEAEVFKGIFDEIAQRRMPGKKPLPVATPESAPAPGMARSIVEQARLTDFRDKFLGRYPQSLRNAAQMALGLYELDPSDAPSQMVEFDEADRAKWEERQRYEEARMAERERVDGLMDACELDSHLWAVMEEEVFSLPAKLGITASKGRKQRKRAVEDKRSMDVHGPLYSHYIHRGLTLFDTAFRRPSPYALQILPRIKELGLPSYVLGVSTPFYARLARLHWNRFGDANAALDVLQEMNAAGLYADADVHELLVTIKDHLHAFTWGAQGHFIMRMMESPPYNGVLVQRLDEMERFAAQSIKEQAADYA